MTMLLSDINQMLERKLAVGALEFALERYQDARMAGSVDAQLAAAQGMYEACKQAWVHLYATVADSSMQPRLGPIGVA